MDDAIGKTNEPGPHGTDASNVQPTPPDRWAGVSEAQLRAAAKVLESHLNRTYGSAHRSEPET